MFVEAVGRPGWFHRIYYRPNDHRDRRPFYSKRDVEGYSIDISAWLSKTKLGDDTVITRAVVLVFGNAHPATVKTPSEAVGQSCGPKLSDRVIAFGRCSALYPRWLTARPELTNSVAKETVEAHSLDI